VGAPDGGRIIYAEQWGASAQAEQLGIRVASELLVQGAQTILDQVYGRP
jgi:hydroxymethylbilane synthase